MLPQLTVYAKIIYLLMVVISGALCTVEDYVIMSQCAHNKAIHVAAEGTVSVTDISQTQNITIVGLPDYVNNNLKIALYAKETQRYLCFNDQWKLVGMKELRDTCYFNETIVHGYFVFRSVVDIQRRVGFTHRGKAVGPKKNVNDACYLFTKIQADQFFHRHTDYFAPKSKSTKNINNGINTQTQATTTIHTHTTSGASARLSSQRAALSAVATTATATATATVAHRNRNNNNNNKIKRVNEMHNNNNNNYTNKNSSNNQNQEYTNGHSSILSNNNNNNNNIKSNNSNLVSNNKINKHQQRVAISQQKHHNNNNSSNNNSSRTREHVRHQPQHQVRHHHNDPNLIARRQQHEHKQKRRQNQQRHQQQQRARNGKIASPTTSATTETKKGAYEQTSPASTVVDHVSTIATNTKATLNAWNATNKQRNREREMEQEQRHATVPIHADEHVATTTKASIKTTTIATKRKGRRRKGRKHKKQQNRAQKQQMLQLVNKEKEQSTRTTQATWPLSDSSNYSQMYDVDSNWTTSSTTYGDYSGEWPSSQATFVASAAAPSSPPSLVSSPNASHTITNAYMSMSGADIDDNFLLITPTNDYSNITDFTSDAFGEEDSFNATLIVNMDDANLSPEPTSATSAQLNSITSQQSYLQKTLNKATSEELDASPTLSAYSESSYQSWAPMTMDPNVATSSDLVSSETMLPSPTASIEVESNAPTQILSDDDNDTVLLEAIADEAELSEAMNSTSSVSEIESSSTSESSSTTTLTDTDTTTATMYRAKNFKVNSKRRSKKPVSIAANIATLFYNQMLAKSNRNENKFAWKPECEEEYSDEIGTKMSERPMSESTTTDTIGEIGGVAWGQQHLNHSGNYFWDKGYAEIPPTASNENDQSKQKNALNRSGTKTNTKVAEVVSHNPLQSLETTATNLSPIKKYLTEGKSLRQASKSRSHNKKLLSLSTKATQAYSSTMATTRAATRSTNVANSSVATENSYNESMANASQMYPLQQLLGNKTFAVLHNLQSQTSYFDGTTNHLVHTSTAATKVTTHLTSTATTANTSSTLTAASTGDLTSATTVAAAVVTKKSIRISTQKLLATPFHQLTYVRNNAGDIDIDNIDNISVYPDLLEESSDMADQHSTERMATDVTRNSRLTIVSGYLPTSATATLPESIRLAKIKINKERKRVKGLRQRHLRRPA